MTSSDRKDPWTALAEELGVPTEQEAQEKSPAENDATPPLSDSHDGTRTIEVHPTTSIYDFRSRMSALDIPLSAIAHPGIARAIEQYQGPKHGSANTSLLGFLHQRGFTLHQLQQALQHVVPVVQGKKPFGRRTHQHRKAL